MIEAELIAFGLSPKEAKIYISTLELGESPASEIANHAGEQRLSTYSVLERLCKKGFVSQYQKKRVKFFGALSPESFFRHCDEQILAIRAKKDRLKDFLPLLEDYFSQNKHNYDGARINLIKDRHLFMERCLSCLNQYPEWWVFQNANNLDLLSGIFRKTKIVPRVVLPLSEHYRLASLVKGMQVKYVPDSYLVGEVYVMIMGSKVMFVLEEEPCFSAIELEHAAISDMLRVIFLLLFKMDFFEKEGL